MTALSQSNPHWLQCKQSLFGQVFDTARSWQCHGWTAADQTALKSNSESAVCSMSTHRVYTHGNNNGYPGCGGCYCCAKSKAAQLREDHLCHTEQNTALEKVRGSLLQRSFELFCCALQEAKIKKLEITSAVFTSTAGTCALRLLLCLNVVWCGGRLRRSNVGERSRLQRMPDQDSVRQDVPKVVGTIASPAQVQAREISRRWPGAT